MTDTKMANSKAVIGAYLAKLRETANLTKAGLAIRLGVDPTLIGYWERGDKLGSLGKLQEMMNLLGGDFDYISALYLIAHGAEGITVPDPKPQKLPDEFQSGKDD